MTLAKVCLLGDVSVGKTSVVRRYVDRTFSEVYLSTVGVAISRKLLHVPSSSGMDAEDVQLILWDLQGGINFESVSPSYLRGAHAAVVVADLTRADTLESVAEHIDHYSEINSGGIIIVALNKSDLHSEPGELRRGSWMHRGGPVTTIVTSAKTGEGIDGLFMTLGNLLLRARTDEPSH